MPQTSLFLLALLMGVLAPPFAAAQVCGDGNVDLGEQCDDGNVANGDCCNSTCQFDAPGTPCEDGNFCTSPDLCGVAGTCTGGGSPNCGLNFDHFLCYQALRTTGTVFVQQNVTLADQFQSVSAFVIKPQSMCNPVNKNGEGFVDQTAHLTSFRIKAPRFVRRHVRVQNQFGDHQIVEVQKPWRLFVPSTKNNVPSTLQVDHFNCYKARILQGMPPEQDLTLVDQFQTTTARLVRTNGARAFCTPVDKNGEGIIDPAGHLTCYHIQYTSGQTPVLPRTVTMTNQFGVQVLKPRPLATLCVPSLKFPTASPSGAFLDDAATPL